MSRTTAHGPDHLIQICNIFRVWTIVDMSSPLDKHSPLAFGIRSFYVAHSYRLSILQ